VNSNGGKPTPLTFRVPTEGELEVAAQTLAAASDLLAAYSTRIDALGSAVVMDLSDDEIPTLRDLGLLFVYYDKFRGHLRDLRVCVEGVLDEGLSDLALVVEDAATEPQKDHDH
jgi:hypothetical protein